MPLAQAITGVPGAIASASACATGRVACAGTTSRMASARAACARSLVTAMPSSIRTPRRNRLSRFCLSWSKLAGSCSHNVTVRPARAVTLASAVPQAPPPSTAMRSNAITRPVARPARAWRAGPRPVPAASAPAARCRADRQPERQPLGARPGDHGAVVGAKLGRRHHQLDAGLEGDALQHLADGLVGGDAAGGDQRCRRVVAFAEQPHAGAQPIEDDLDNRLLKRRAQISDVLVAERRKLLGLQPQCGLQSGQREIRLGAAVHRPWQREPRGVAARRLLLDLRSAGIAQSEQLGGLVEGFADGIVDGGAEQRVIADAAHRHDLGVAAGGEEQAIGKRHGRRQPRGQRMRLEMVDRHQRLAADQRDCLGGGGNSNRRFGGAARGVRARCSPGGAARKDAGNASRPPDGGRERWATSERRECAARRIRLGRRPGGRTGAAGAWPPRPSRSRGSAQRAAAEVLRDLLAGADLEQRAAFVVRLDQEHAC